MCERCLKTRIGDAMIGPRKSNTANLIHFNRALIGKVLFYFAVVRKRHVFWKSVAAKRSENDQGQWEVALDVLERMKQSQQGPPSAMHVGSALHALVKEKGGWGWQSWVLGLWLKVAALKCLQKTHHIASIIHASGLSSV